jgi:conjugal transfer pilus assembly protein TraE
MKLRITKYLQASSNAFAENTLLKACFIVMLLATVINTVSMMRIIKNTRTIIIPAGLGFEFEIAGDSANDIYLKRMARYLVELKGNVTAANATEKFNELLSLTHPSRYGALRDQWMRQAQQLKQYPSISYYVTIDENKPIKVVANKTLYVHASKQRIVGQEIARKTPLQYRIDFMIEDGRFWLLNIQELADA